MKPLRYLIVLTFVLLHQLTSLSVRAQTDEVDSYLEAEMKNRQIPGLALVVIKDGTIIKMKGYGIANLEHDVPVTPNTVFELASLTKQFTAAAIMLLVEEGAVKLSDPIGQYLPTSANTEG